MKIKNLVFPILFFIGLFLFVMQCHKPEKIDPCKDQSPFEADFEILEEVGDTLIATDTVLPNTIVFRASGNYDSYEWRLSGDELNRVWTTSSFKLNFNQPYGMIEATLIAYKKPNTTCFPDDNGIDTVRKKFWVVSETYAKNNILDTYVGYNEDNPEDTFSVRIGYDLINQSGDFINKDYIVENLPKGCLVKKNYVTVSIRLGGNSFATAGQTDYPCDVLSMCGKINGDKIYIQYLIQDKSKEVISGQYIPHYKKQFIGTRKK